MTDPYQTLDIDPSASWEEVRSAYRDLVQLYHPDKHTNHSPSVQKRAVKKFTEVNQAYENIKLIYEKEQRLKNKKEETRQTHKKYKEKSERDSSQQTDSANFQETLEKSEQGDAKSQFNLGLMYDNGQGVPQDNKEAVKWYRLSAEQGDATAQSTLGVMYRNGEGVLQDYVLAHMWHNLSSSNGNENARKFKNDLEEIMSPSQIEKAQEMARNWKPTKK